MVQRVAARSTFPLQNKAAGGGLEKRIRAARNQGKSYVDIAFELRDAGIEVSPSTVHRWCRELGIQSKEPAA